MISYRYSSQLSPPAPFVHVALRTPDGSKQLDQVPAQVDTAADRTAIPMPIAIALALVRVRNVPVVGVGGQVSSVSSFFVDLAVHNLPYRGLEVFAIAGEPYVILGRDVLNDYRLVLDGPRLVLEIDAPSQATGAIQTP